jgi:hypothetical protein
VHTTGSRPPLVVSTDGRAVVSHSRSRPLADLAEVTSLTSVLGDALRRLRPRGTGHAPGRIAVDLAVMLADGGEAIADLALPRDQPEVSGPVASAPTAWRLLAGIDPNLLRALRTARAAALEIAWLQAGETHDCASWTTPARPWPACYGRATPRPTPPPTTSACSMPNSPGSPTPTAMAPTSSSAPTAPDPVVNTRSALRPAWMDFSAHTPVRSSVPTPKHVHRFTAPFGEPAPRDGPGSTR